MENIYRKILDKTFSSLTCTACHGYNCLLLLGSLLNVAIEKSRYSGFFHSTFRKCQSGDCTVVSSLSMTRLWMRLNIFFEQRFATVMSFTFIFELARTCSVCTTCTYIKPVPIWRFFNTKRLSGGRYSIPGIRAGRKVPSSRGTDSFLSDFLDMNTDTRAHTRVYPHTQTHTESLSPTYWK